MTRASDILNWLPVDDQVTTSGQPTEEQMAAIRDEGVEVVVNLGLHSHPKALPDEAATVTALGMEYVHIPVDFENPTEEDYRQFVQRMEANGTRRVHVHCIVNARVTAFFYRYRTERQGGAEPQARAVMERIWKPGGVWARFIGDLAGGELPHRFAGRDY